jgi:hypothetical protein
MPAIFFLSLPPAVETSSASPLPPAKADDVLVPRGSHPFDGIFDRLNAEWTQPGGGPQSGPFKL